MDEDLGHSKAFLGLQANQAFDKTFSIVGQILLCVYIITF